MRTIMLSVYLAVSSSSFAAETQTAVIPPENKAGSGATSAIIMSEGIRYMGVYDPAVFIEALPQGGSITKIEFRLDEVYLGEGLTQLRFPDVEVRLSTISPVNAPPGSTEFADFVGSNETVVFRGSLQWQTQPNTTGINPFDLDITLNNPFTYDPRSESLVLDIRTFAETGDDNFRIDTMGPGSLSFSLAGQITRPEAQLFFRNPPVMQIEFVPVPEPATGALLLLGLVLLGVFRRR